VPEVWWLAAIAFVLSAARRGAPRRAWVIWVGTAVLVGAALSARERARAPGLPAGAVADDRAADTVTGVVDGPVTAARWGSAFAMSLDGSAARAWVTIDREVSVVPGDRLRVTGRLRTPRGYRNPGGIDRIALARTRGIDVELRAIEVEVAGPPAWTPWR